MRQGQAERASKSTAAQHLRPDGVLRYAVPFADKLALVASDGSVTLAGTERADPHRPGLWFRLLWRAACLCSIAEVV